MTHEERERLLRLQSHEMHEAVDTTPGIEVLKYDSGAIRLEGLGFSAYITIDGTEILLSENSKEVLLIDTKHIDAVIALLQLARQITGGQ